MQRISHKKRIRSAWLLLLVYIPMLLAVTFHQHGEAWTADAETYCADCAHHVHHDGHLLALQHSLHDCVLCQWQTTPCLSAAPLLWAAVVVLLRIILRAECSPCLCRTNDVISTRAPPCF